MKRHYPILAQTACIRQPWLAIVNKLLVQAAYVRDTLWRSQTYLAIVGPGGLCVPPMVAFKNIAGHCKQNGGRGGVGFI